MSSANPDNNNDNNNNTGQQPQQQQQEQQQRSSQSQSSPPALETQQKTQTQLEITFASTNEEDDLTEAQPQQQPTQSPNGPSALDNRRHPPRNSLEIHVDNDDDNNSDKPPALPRMTPLANQGELARARSLSRMFNQVPKDRPSIQQSQVDLLEYYAHLACLQTHPVAVWQEKQNLQDALCVVHQGGTCSIQRYGRLFTRLRVATLSISLGCVQVDEEEDGNDEKANQDVTPAHKYSAKQWKRLTEEFQVCRNSCLRHDANLLVPIVAGGGETNQDKSPKENATLDKHLEEHTMFQADYNESIQLLKVQEIAARLREELLSMLPNSKEKTGDDKTNNSISKEGDPISTTQLDEVTQRYEQHLSQLFGGAAPSSLTKFLRKTAPKSMTNRDFVVRLHNDCLKVVRGGSTTYSFSTVQQKTRDLLLKWSESILSCPTLVRLGYGGVRAPIVAQDDEAHDNDDVSSYGMDEEFARLDSTENSGPKRGPKTSATSDERFATRGRSRSTGSHNRHREEDRKTSDDDEAKSSTDNKKNTDVVEDELSPAAAQAGAAAQNLLAPVRRRPEKAPRRLSMEQRASLSTGATAAAASTSEHRRSMSPSIDEDRRKDNGGSRATRKEKNSENEKRKRKPSADRRERAPAVVVPEAENKKPSPAKRRRPMTIVLDDTSSTSSSSSCGFGAYTPKDNLGRSKRRGVDRNPQSGADSPPATVVASRSKITNSQEAALWKDASQSSESTWKRKRTAWTSEESDAVREGYLRYGQQWRMIKDNCGGRLSQRTNVQIKDRFRTMLKRGEIELNVAESEAEEG